MAESVHGHAVMAMMLDQGKAYTRQSLCEAIIAEFGSETRYHTCCAEGLDAAALVDFLAEKGKFVEVAGGFKTTPEHHCSHGEH